MPASCRENFTKIGVAQLIWGYGDADALIINREDQNGDLLFSSTEAFAPHQNNSSSAPVRHTLTGQTVMIAVPMSNMSIEFLAARQDTPIIVDPNDSGNRGIGFYDNAGKDTIRKQVLIKPYEGANVTSDRSQWILLPCAELMNQDAINLAFGLTTQQGYTFGFNAQADANGLKAWLGDPDLYSNL